MKRILSAHRSWFMALGLAVAVTGMTRWLPDHDGRRGDYGLAGAAAGRGAAGRGAGGGGAGRAGGGGGGAGGASVRGGWATRRGRGGGAARNGDGYASGVELRNEPEPFRGDRLAHPLVAVLPLVLVGVANLAFTRWIPAFYGTMHGFAPSVIGSPAPVVQEVAKVAAIWAVQGALLVGILTVLAFAWKPVVASFAEGTKSAVGGAMLASMNTASEYGFGAIIAALPGFLVVANALQAIPDPLVNQAVSVTALAGITGSASGGLSIALAAMGDTFIANAQAYGIPMEVLHRVAAMASGGMDTLPHNGAVITLLAVTGLTHRQSYKDIFAITAIKTLAVFFIIGLYYATGWV